MTRRIISLFFDNIYLVNAMDSDNIQKLLDLVPSAIVIVTVGTENERAGMTASWNAQVSWKPPYFGIAIYNEWRTLELILKFKEFAVHLVSEDLLKAALALFGGMSSRKVDKIKVAAEKYGLRIGKAKKITAPIIEDAPLIFECRLMEHHIIGDHYLVVGEPVEVHKNNDKRPLIYWNGKVYTIGDLAKPR